MGSLTSRPKVPQMQQQPVIVTVPSYMPPPTSAAPAPAVFAPEASAPGDVALAPALPGSAPAGKEEAQRLAREDNLLRRARGRMGTVLTGLSGLLSQAAPVARKTLLGE